MTPVATPEDRSIAVPPGRIVRTGYVPTFAVTLANRSRMAVGDIDAAYRRQLCLGDSQRWPCPLGTWDGQRFTIHDGRHAYTAALMLGFEHILVAWLE